MARTAKAKTVTPGIVTYFSHSYRDADRPVNDFFWRLFHDAGFLLTVDPMSTSFSIPFLEMMMFRSSCFASVITYRADKAPIFCSPYLQFEYGLAVLAQKPRLVFVDNRIPGRLFSDRAEEICVFNANPNSLEAERARYKQQVDAFAKKLQGQRGQRFRLPQRVGIVVDPEQMHKSIYQSVFPQLQSVFLEAGFDVELAPLQFDQSYKVCLALERYDFLLMDVRARNNPPWAVGLALGRLIPCIYLCHLDQGETPAAVALPTISIAHRVQDGKVTLSSIIYWNDAESLQKQVLEHVSKFSLERLSLYSEDDCFAYFASLGRPADKVFLSNADSANETVNQLKIQLRKNNIRHFHYKNTGDIPIGSDWEQALRSEVDSSKLFAAFINEQYKKSHQCLRELEWAVESSKQGKMVVLPYLLEHTNPPSIIGHLQATPLYVHPNPDQQLECVVKDLDDRLRSLAGLAISQGAVKV